MVVCFLAHVDCKEGKKVTVWFACIMKHAVKTHRLTFKKKTTKSISTFDFILTS